MIKLFLLKTAKVNYNESNYDYFAGVYNSTSVSSKVETPYPGKQ